MGIASNVICCCVGAPIKEHTGAPYIRRCDPQCWLCGKMGPKIAKISKIIEKWTNFRSNSLFFAEKNSTNTFYENYQKKLPDA